MYHLRSLESRLSYLDPSTAVFMCKSPLSMKVYNNAGIVDRAKLPVRILLYFEITSFEKGLSFDIRPTNKAKVVRVPCSASNLSKRGVRANRFKNVWKIPL